MFNCVVCDKIFNTKRNMLRHENTHRGFRFACDKCFANFTYKSDLTSHIKKMHPSTESINQHLQPESDDVFDNSNDIYDNYGNNFNLFIHCFNLN